MPLAAQAVGPAHLEQPEALEDEYTERGFHGQGKYQPEPGPGASCPWKDP